MHLNVHLVRDMNPPFASNMQFGVCMCTILGKVGNFWMNIAT